MPNISFVYTGYIIWNYKSVLIYSKFKKIKITITLIYFVTTILPCV